MNDTTNEPQAAAAAQKTPDEMLDENAAQLAEAAVRKEHGADLASFVQKSAAAADDYTAQRRKELLERWKDQDEKIGGLLKKLMGLPDWKKQVPAVTALFLAIGKANQDLELAPLEAEPAMPSETQGLYWKRAWQQGTRDARKRDYERSKLTLAAWEKPAQTLDKVLGDNARLIADAEKMLLQSSLGTLPYDLLFKLVPMHLRIAPDLSETAIKPDPQINGATLEDWAAVADPVVGPLPKLIPAADYLSTRCGLILNKFAGAMEKLAKAEGDLARTGNAIARRLTYVENKKKSIDKDARAELAA